MHVHSDLVVTLILNHFVGLCSLCVESRSVLTLLLVVLVFSLPQPLPDPMPDMKALVDTVLDSVSMSDIRANKLSQDDLLRSVDVDVLRSSPRCVDNSVAAACV
jgi:hypothetical protein